MWLCLSQWRDAGVPAAGVETYQAPSPGQVNVAVDPNSKRLQLLQPFAAWDGKDIEVGLGPVAFYWVLCVILSCSGRLCCHSSLSLAAGCMALMPCSLLSALLCGTCSALSSNRLSDQNQSSASIK